MKKLSWILTAVIIVLAILCATLWQRNTVEENDIKVMCKSSVNAALEHFEEYSATGNEEEYISGVAEFPCLYDNVPLPCKRGEQRRIPLVQYPLWRNDAQPRWRERAYHRAYRST